MRQPLRRRAITRWSALFAALVGLFASGVVAGGDPAGAWEHADAGTMCSPTPPARPAMRISYGEDLPVAYRAAVRAAAAAWEESLPGLLTIEVSAQRASTFHANTAYVTVSTSTEESGAYAGVRATRCGNADNGTYDENAATVFPRSMDELTQHEKTAVMVHEIGHVLRLDHPGIVDWCLSVMVTIGCPTQTAGPYPDDIAGVLATLAPNATAGFPADATIAFPGGKAMRGGWAGGGFLPITAPAADTRYRWTFVPSARAGNGPAGERAGVVVNSASGLCLASWATDNGRQVAIEQPCYETGERSGAFWAVQPRADGSITLRNQKDGQCLRSYGDDPQTRAVMGDCANPSAVLTVRRPDGEPARATPPTQARPLVGQLSGRCVDVSKTDPSARMIIFDCSNGDNQKFRFHDETRTITVFEPSFTDSVDGPDPTRCVQAEGTADRSSILAAPCRPRQPSQVWHRRGDGTIYNPASNKCVNVSGGSTSNGAELILSPCGTEPNEVFNAVGVLSTEPRFSVRTLLGTGKVLTAVAGLGTLQNDTDGESQNWMWTPASGDVNTGMLTSWQSPASTADLQCLTAPAAAAFTTMRSCNHSDAAQRWKASTNPNGSTTFTSVAWPGQCLDLFEAKTDDATPILIYDCKTSGDRRNQQWRILSENPQGSLAPAGPTTAPVTLSSRANSQHVAARTDKGSVLQPSSTTVGAGELFDLVFNDDVRASVSLRSHATGKYVTVHPVSAELIANATSIGDREKFTIVESPEGWIALSSVATGAYVVAEGGGAGSLLANRTAIGAWEKFDLSGTHHLPEVGWNPGLGAVLASSPSVVFDASEDRHFAAIRGSDGAMWWKGRRLSWTGWKRVGAPPGSTIVGKPAMTVSGSRVEVWALASDSRVYSIASANSGASWGAWTDSGQLAAASPAVGFDAHLAETHVVSTLTDGTTWHYVRSSSGRWLAATKILVGIGVVGEAAMTVYGDHVNVFARGSDGLMYETYSTTGGRWWTSVEGLPLAGGLQSSPAAAYDPVAGSLFVAVKGADGKAYLNRWNEGWSGWKGIPGPTDGTFTDAPALVAYGYKAQLFARGTDGYGWYAPIDSYY